MKRYLVILVLLALVALSLLLFLRMEHEQAKTLSIGTFQLSEDTATDFLSEKVALEYANKVLARIYPSVPWKPVEDGRSVAPDGTKDRFLSRNADQPSTEGTILFTNAKPSNAVPNSISAKLSLRDHDLTCVLSRSGL